MTSIAANVGGKPRLMVTEEAADDLVTEVIRYPGHENACGLVGLTFANGSMAITGIIPASPMDIVRRESTAQFGGDTLAAAVEWMDINYGLLHPEDVKAKAEFTFFWKAHTHQQLKYSHFSSTDNKSILDAVKKHGMQKAIGVLGIIDRMEGTKRSNLGRTGLTAKRLFEVSLLFYYLDQEMVDRGQEEPILLTPKIIKAKNVPALPPLPWSFTNEDSFKRQLRQLDEFGARVVPLYRDVDKDPIQELQFVIFKPGKWKGTLFITTDWDYPKSSPLIQVLSDIDPTRPGKELHEVQLDIEGKPIWTPESDFLDVVLELEELKEL